MQTKTEREGRGGGEGQEEGRAGEGRGSQTRNSEKGGKAGESRGGQQRGEGVYGGECMGGHHCVCDEVCGAWVGEELRHQHEVKLSQHILGNLQLTSTYFTRP